MNPRPVLSEGQKELLASLGLTHRCTDLVVLIDHPDLTVTRLEPSQFRTWLDGYLLGKSAK